ncbi:hypothetical protein EsDP_00006950 [Epichloe bromicola]|uniref:DNA polymerase delta subunit 4 n=1 Tax=Epichloe bromicola TaxID=79588 RepID=A0ABQ0CZ45_9HYPO
MPTTRRSTGATRGRTGPTKGQSTISFTNKVTKAVPKDVKSLVTPSNTTRIEVPQRMKPVEKKIEEEEVVVDKNEEEDDDEEDEEEQPLEAEIPEKSEAEIKAETLTDSHIDKYWRGIEKERKAPRVHQEGLSVNDKVLRYFDVSSQYGPCIGIDRTRRWERAERLGLNPPIEVLAVLLKEHKKPSGGVETAQMDNILNSIAIGS